MKPTVNRGAILVLFGSLPISGSQPLAPQTQRVPQFENDDVKVVRQWIIDGADSIRTGLGSIWLTKFKIEIVRRIPPENL